MADIKDEQQKPFEAIEKITKAIVAVVAVSYALGMVVSNQYLIALGASDFSSVRPKYILTGGWVLIMMVLSALPVLLPLISCEKLLSWGSLLLFGLGLLFSCLAGAGLLRFLRFDYAWLNEQHEVLKTAGTLAAVCCICGGLLVIAIRKVRLIEIARSQWMGHVVVALIVCCLLALVTSQVAGHIYGHIPEAMGGGKAVMAYIILNDKGVGFWEQFLPLHPRPLIAPKRGIQFAKILYQDEKQLIIEIEQERPDKPQLKHTNKSLILKRDLVDGIYIDSDPNRL
ncbi:MAG TPA: hypothetical protein VGH51_16720 [Candidatus Angelobacter sp.]|jgi:hypothetical protein